jgi:hypothetical protein
MIPTILAQDAIRVNASHIPVGTQAAGYTTGLGDIPWDDATFAAHNMPYPAVRIDQDPAASDATADILDVEALAATIQDIPGWLTRARANYINHVRPEQRWPGIYCGMNNLDSAVAICQGANLINVPFWTAQPGNTVSFAIQRVASATGNYPCIGCQYAWGNFVDFNAFSLPWIQTMSGDPVTTPTTTYCQNCKSIIYGPRVAESACPSVPVVTVDRGVVTLTFGPHVAFTVPAS